MAARRSGAVLDAAELRAEGLACRDWLATELASPNPRPGRGRLAQHRVWSPTFAPSLRSADPRFGHQPGTASFCNAGR